MHVLVVDDDEAVRDIVSDLLADAGYDVSCASDGREALSMVERGAFDLVLSDLKMPHLDGLALAQILRRSQHALPIVIMSANRGETNLAGLPFLRKPFEVNRLLHMVAGSLNGASGADESHVRLMTPR